MFGGCDDPPSPAAGQGDVPGAEAGQSLTALLVVLTAPRRRGCSVGFFMLDARDVQPGVGDGVGGVVEGVILVRELIEDAEFAQHPNVLGLGGGEQDPGASVLERPRFRQPSGVRYDSSFRNAIPRQLTMRSAVLRVTSVRVAGNCSAPVAGRGS